MSSVVVYSPYRPEHACAEIRLCAPMRRLGWNVIWVRQAGSDHDQFAIDLARGIDLVFVQRQFPSLKNEKVLRAALRSDVPIVFDLDDMLLDVPPWHPSSAELSRRAPFIRWVLSEADLITVSTEPLAASLRKVTRRPIRVQPNCVDTSLFVKRRTRSEDGRFRFLISGTSTHARDWTLIERPLRECLDAHRGRVEAVFFGNAPSSLAADPRVRYVPFESAYRGYAEQLAKLSVDAALVPLEDSAFNRCKSNIKWLEYSCLGIPGAYSDVGPYRASIAHGKTGLLVGNSEESWFNAMLALVSEPHETAAMAERARQQVLTEFAIDRGAREFESVLAPLAGRGRHRYYFSGASTALDRWLARTIDAVQHSALFDRHVKWRLKR